MLSTIIDMLDDMVHDLSIFQEYEWIFSENADLEETLVKAFIDVIKFWTNVCHFLRRNTTGKYAHC